MTIKFNIVNQHDPIETNETPKIVDIFLTPTFDKNRHAVEGSIDVDFSIDGGAFTGTLCTITENGIIRHDIEGFEDLFLRDDDWRFRDATNDAARF